MPERVIERGFGSIGRFIHREVLMVPVRVSRRAEALTESRWTGRLVTTMVVVAPFAIALKGVHDISSMLIAAAGAAAGELALIKIVGADMPISTPPSS